MATDTKGLAMAAQSEEVVDISVLYNSLEEMSRLIPFREIDLIVRLRLGIKPKHAENVLYLYFYHLYKVEQPLYKRICDAKDESELKAVLRNKIKKNCSGAVKSICIQSDLFSESFLKIINAYLDYVEKV